MLFNARLLFSPIFGQPLPIRFNCRKFNGLRAPRIVLYLQWMILWNALPLILYLEFHEVKKILKFQLDYAKSVIFLKSRWRGVGTTLQIIQWYVQILVKHRATRMVAFAPARVGDALVAELNPVIKPIRLNQRNHRTLWPFIFVLFQCFWTIVHFGITGLEKLRQILP